MKTIFVAKHFLPLTFSNAEIAKVCVRWSKYMHCSNTISHISISTRKFSHYHQSGTFHFWMLHWINILDVKIRYPQEFQKPMNCRWEISIYLCCFFFFMWCTTTSSKWKCISRRRGKRREIVFWGLQHKSNWNQNTKLFENQKKSSLDKGKKQQQKRYFKSSKSGSWTYCGKQR